MLHPSYTDLMKVVNSEVEEGEEKIVNSRYSIVLATAKRARQLIDDAPAKVTDTKCPKPLSIAIDELNNGKIKILSEEEQIAQAETEFAEEEVFDVTEDEEEILLDEEDEVIE